MLLCRVGVCESEVLEESPSLVRGVERQYRSIDLDVSRSADTFDQLLRHLEPDIIALLRRNLTAAFDG